MEEKEIEIPGFAFQMKILDDALTLEYWKGTCYWLLERII